MKNFKNPATILFFLLCSFITFGQNINMPSGTTNIWVVSGYFYDSGGSGGSYGTNQDRTITFYPAITGMKVNLRFTQFSTETRNDCSNYYDRLLIYNGNSTSAPAMHSGNGFWSTNCAAQQLVTPRVFTSTAADGSITVRFTSDSGVNSDGWTAEISLTGSNCGTTLYDTGGPSNNYWDGLDYTYTLYPPTTGSKMQINFSSFATESANCSTDYDRLYLYNGNSTGAPSLGTFWTGCSVPSGTYTSTAADGSLTLRFKSDGNSGGSGWTASLSCYNPTPDPITGNTILCNVGQTTQLASGLSSTGITGGTVTTSGGYRIHTFTSSGTFQIPAGLSGSVEALVVAGGGGGGFRHAGGGGAGGVVSTNAYTASGNITVTVGSGGAGSSSGNGANGANSVFGSLTATGGGGGAGNGSAGSAGGSGGGGSNGGAGGNGTAGQGNKGGNQGTACCNAYGAGGGGAGAAAANSAGSAGSAGGAGASYSISGTAVTYAGGGGGGNGTNTTVYAGGTGGGGAGGTTAGSMAGTNGTANTGGGGGGGGANGGSSGSGGNGGSGIVIARYPTPGTWSSDNTAVATVDAATGVVTAAGNGIATITYTNTAGGSTSVAVMVGPIPAVPTVSASTPSFCPPGTTVLNANGMAPGGNGFQGNGSNSYVEVVQDIPEQNFTIEMWIKTAAANSGVFSVSSSTFGSGGHDRHIYISSGQLCFRVYAGAGWSTNYTINDNKWHHVALTVATGIGQKAYVDGKLVATFAYDRSDFDWQDRYYIGFSNDVPGNEYFNGSIDNVRIWNVVRTPAQILSSMYYENPTSTTGLVSHLKLNGNATASAGANGTASNATWAAPTHYTYTWSGGPSLPAASTNEAQTTSSVSTAGIYNYVVQATVSGGCGGTNSSSVTVTVGVVAPSAVGNITVGPTFGAGALLPDASITANACYNGCATGGSHEPWRGRLFNQNTSGATAWASQSNVVNTDYIQYDLGSAKPVDGISTQSRGLDCCTDQRVMAYNVTVSLDGSTWTTVPGSPFTGNTTVTQAPVTNMFTERQWARYVRIIPTTINSHMSMRADIISIPCAASATVYASADLPAGATGIRWYDASGGGNLLGSGQSISISISANKTIYAEAYNASCTSTRTAVTLKINNPSGTPSVFGNNAWNVYGYFGADQTLASTLYAGTYTQSLLSFDTQNMGSNGWANTAAPSSSAGWAGCPLPYDQMTFVHKRKGFPCGTYTISMVNWDDNTTVYINGVQQWTCGAWSGAGSCTTPVGTFQLDGNSEIEVRTQEGVGGANAAINMGLTVPSSLSANGTSRTCYISGGSSYVDFVDINGKLIASINPNGNNLGNVTATSYVDGASIVTYPCGSTDPKWATATLGRRWVITPSTPPTTAVSVRLPFADGEFTSLQTAAAGTSSNPNDNVSTISNLKVSKYSGSNQDASWSNNCTSAGGSGGTLAFNQAGSGAITTGNGYPGNIASSSYVQVSVPGFSEFWLHNTGSLSPLPVELTNFSASCDIHDNVELHWTTESEHNSQKFIVERSRELVNWIFVDELAAADNSSQEIDYATMDNDPLSGTSYYRLLQVDNDGKQSIYGPVSVDCGSQEDYVSVFPNPATGDFTVEVSSSEGYANASIQICDMTGKILLQNTMNILQGVNDIPFGNSGLNSGTYIVKVLTGNDHFKPVRLVITN